MTQAQHPYPGLGLANRLIGGTANRLTPFYRRHPYRGGLWWSEVDMRVAVCPQTGFLYNRLPKNANSTVTSLLANRIFGPDDTVSPKHRFVRPSRLSAAQVRAVETEYFKFVILRDPYTRTLSAFLDKVMKPRTQRRGPWRWFARHGIETPSFEDFCKYLDDGGLHADNHWAPQVDGLVLPLDRFDMVARLEALQADLDTIHRRLFGAPLGELQRKGPKSSGAEGEIARHYTPHAAEIVSRLFARDFSELGYPVRDVTA
ncbi:sulfotransferase family protein [Rhodosalinus sp. FB01]|uniref:sulfotransferase family protein n=1 Tax=Rhodosalinus sp. FB01 TaxID=3239194 RepID=UPI003525090A